MMSADGGRYTYPVHAARNLAAPASLTPRSAATATGISTVIIDYISQEEIRAYLLGAIVVDSLENHAHMFKKNMTGN